MQFPIDVLFVKGDGRVVKVCRNVRPGRMAAAWGAEAVVELPVGAIDKADVSVDDTLELLLPPLTPSGMRPASN
jgi:uncharacterized membrane protein (UPF0127 family)